MSTSARAGTGPNVATNAAAAGARPQQAAQQGGFLSSPLAKSLLQAFAVWMIINNITSYLSSRKTQKQGSAIVNVNGTFNGNATLANRTAAARTPQVTLEPLWQQGKALDVLVKLSTANDGVINFQDTSLPSVSWKDVPLSKSSWQRDWDTIVRLPQTVQNNGSLWADIFVSPAGTSPDPQSGSFESEHLHIRKLLTRHHVYRKPRLTKKLLSSAKQTPEEQAAEQAAIEAEKKAPKQIISYWHQNLTLEVVCNSGPVAYSGLPPVLQKHIHRARGNETNAQGNGYFYPITYANDFWLLREHMTPINSTTPELPLRITLSPTSHWKWQIMSSLDESFAQAAEVGGSSGEMDEVKRMLTETSPWLLITTTVVTVLHMLFEILAFTSDVSHWRKKQDNLVGVSLIILLYLLDNNENTSWMASENIAGDSCNILFSQGTGLLIEAWKIPKTVDINLVQTTSGFLPYKLDIKDKHVLSEDEIKTQEADKLAFRYVTMAAVPLLVGYTIYSLFYNEHRSAYSFVIQTLTAFVQAFGFVQMVPQLIINYQLKSTAHLPMKTLTYKFLTTIVDDFFSFIIKMPWLHRLACFRDDVVFVILLFQMWIYKTDYSRTNEYGQKLSDDAAKTLIDKDHGKDVDDTTVGDKVDPKLESRKNR
ncbi:hypothetical protein OIO90_003801 [Microbotryomycetes sp. JL221]|nr:hypothetical protein OIO90_003801 [Microbotryomycetes sp. JL221]